MGSLRMDRVAVLLLLLLPTSAWSHEQDKAKGILDRALHALGKANQKHDLPAATWTAKATMYGLGDPVEYTGQWAVVPPERASVHMAGKFHGRSFDRLLVIRGDHGWIRQDGVVTTLEPTRLIEEKERLHAGWVTTLWPLRAADFDLHPLPPEKTGAQRTGLRVHHAGYRDVLLYFDASGQLVQSETQRKDSATNATVTETVRYGDYRRMDGVLHPMHVTVWVDGKRIVDGRLTNYEQHAHLPSQLFRKPE